MSRNPDRSPENSRQKFLQLIRREAELDAAVQVDDLQFAGLRDFHTILELAAIRLELARRLCEDGQHAELARFKALEALRAMDDLRELSLSDEHSAVIRGSQEFLAAQAQMEEFLLAGGSVLLEDRVADINRTRKLARIVSLAISKHSHRDDVYQPLFRTEKLRKPLRLLVRALLPVLAREYQAEPPYGLEEGSEEVFRARYMTVPLPQAIHYLSMEVLPTYREALDAEPGHAGLQESIRTIEQRIERLQELKVYPRSTLLPIEKDIQTDTLCGFTADGIPLVKLSVSVEVRSGTNIDRIRDLIQSEVVRRCANEGFVPELDREYQSLTPREGDHRTGTRAPSLRLDHRRLFFYMVRYYPSLIRIDDRAELSRLLEHCRVNGVAATRRLIGAELSAFRSNELPSSGHLKSYR